MEPPKALPTTDEIYRLVKENNKMLKAMRRDAFVKSVFSFIWWILIFIVVPYLTWLWLQPYLEKITAAYGQVQAQSNSLNTALHDLQGGQFQQLYQQLTGQGK